MQPYLGTTGLTGMTVPVLIAELTMPKIDQRTTSDPTCVACSGTTISSRGGPCMACLARDDSLFVTWKRRPEILLCANTVKPMHGVVPRLILGKEWWDKTRREAYASTAWHCIACGVPKYEAIESQWLEGHEVYKIDYERGRQTYLETVPLCHYCHSFIHEGRLKALVGTGEVTREKYNAVMAYGNNVLKDAKLKKVQYTGKFAAWGKWRLVLSGKLYPPLYKNHEEWEKHFNNSEDE